MSAPEATDVVATQKALILDQVKQAQTALASLQEAASKLDDLLYCVRYFDDLQSLHSDAVEAVYRATDDAHVPHLSNALIELAEELA